MQESNKPAGIADGLLEPDDGFVGAGTVVGGGQGVFGAAEGFIGGCDGEDEEESVGGTRKEGEQGGFGEGVNVVIGERLREAELVDEA